MACVAESISDMQGEAPTEAIPAVLQDTAATDAVVENDSSNADYLKNLAARIFLWLAIRCVREGINEFKISDVKHQFETITYVLLEPAVAILVGEGKVIVPEARSRIIVYTVDVVQALLVAPPLPDSPEGQSVDGQTKVKKPTAKRAIHVGTGKENPGSSDVPKAKAAKTKDGLQERRPNHGSSSSSSSSHDGGMRPISPFRDDDIDDSTDYPTDEATGAVPRAVARFESSPVVSFPRWTAPTTFLSQEKQQAMMSILCEAFQDCGEGVITKGQLIRLMRDQLPGGLTQGPGLGQGEGQGLGVLDDMGDIEEFLRHMSEENKIMVEGEDIYEI